MNQAPSYPLLFEYNKRLHIASIPGKIILNCNQVVEYISEGYE